jgi:UDP-N-acetylenolpyruvoylglucosamine reductase
MIGSLPNLISHTFSLHSLYVFFIFMILPRGIVEHRDITHFSAFKTPARARYFYDVTERQEALNLPDIYAFAQSANLPVVIIGGGTNCLFAFDEFEGIIVHNRHMGWDNIDITDSGVYVRVNSGELSHNISMKLYTHHGISTLVPWIGLP